MGDEARKDEIRATMQQLLEMDARLANDVINYVFMQLNSESYLATINQSEYAVLVKQAVKGANQIIFLKHYSRDLVSKRAFASSATNLIILLYTRTLDGRDRELTLAEINSKQQINIQR